MSFEILWQGFVDSSQVKMKEVPSTLRPFTQEEKKRMKETFAKWKEKNPNAFDGPLWRYEGVKEVDEEIEILVSPTTYLPHNVLRNDKGRDKETLTPENIQYPNPASINAVPVTFNKYLIIGLKGGDSDQRGVGAIGGFLDRDIDKNTGRSKPPEDTFTATIREMIEESTLEKGDIDISGLRVMGAIYGSNKDTTFATYVPLKQMAHEIGLSPKEHAAKIIIPASIKRLEMFLKGDIEQAIYDIEFNDEKTEEMYDKGKIEMIPVDHCYGDIHLLLKNIKAGKI